MKKSKFGIMKPGSFYGIDAAACLACIGAFTAVSATAASISVILSMMNFKKNAQIARAAKITLIEKATDPKLMNYVLSE